MEKYVISDISMILIHDNIDFWNKFEILIHSKRSLMYLGNKIYCFIVLLHIIDHNVHSYFVSTYIQDKHKRKNAFF